MAEIKAAPAAKQAELMTALGKPRCGHINRQSLELEDQDPNFAPAVPFVTSFSGVVGAAETMKWLMGDRYLHSLHFQKSFESSRSRALEMKCNPSCECQSLLPQPIGSWSGFQSRRMEGEEPYERNLSQFRCYRANCCSANRRKDHFWFGRRCTWHTNRKESSGHSRLRNS
jgi:hypothetical protein